MSLRSRDNIQAKCTELVVIRARMSDLLWWSPGLYAAIYYHLIYELMTKYFASEPVIIIMLNTSGFTTEENQANNLKKVIQESAHTRYVWYSICFETMSPLAKLHLD